jgi:hypothetical protein
MLHIIAQGCVSTRDFVCGIITIAIEIPVWTWVVMLTGAMAASVAVTIVVLGVSALGHKCVTATWKFAKVVGEYFNVNPVNKYVYGPWTGFLARRFGTTIVVVDERAKEIAIATYCGPSVDPKYHLYKLPTGQRIKVATSSDERSIGTSPISVVVKHDYVTRIVNAQGEHVANATALNVINAKEQRSYLITTSHAVESDDIARADRFVVGVKNTGYSLHDQPTLFNKLIRCDGDITLIELSEMGWGQIGVKRKGAPSVSQSSGAVTGTPITCRHYSTNGEAHVTRGNVLVATEATGKKYSVVHNCSTESGTCGAVCVETQYPNRAVLLHTTGFVNTPQNAGTDIAAALVDAGILTPTPYGKEDDYNDSTINEDSADRRNRIHQHVFDDAGRRARGMVRGDFFESDYRNGTAADRGRAGRNESTTTPDAVADENAELKSAIQALKDLIATVKKPMDTDTNEQGNGVGSAATTLPGMKSQHGPIQSAPPCPPTGEDSTKSSTTSGNSKRARRKAKAQMASTASELSKA